MAEYIERQAAIKDVYAIHTFDTEYDAALIDRLDVRYVLEALPSADVEPVRHGRWEQGGYACGETEWICSECGFSEWRTSNARMKFCMNCGARMDGEQDD